MAVNFPSNPTNGDTVTVGGINYVYDSTQGVWSDSPQGLAQSIDNLTDVDTSTTAPANRQVLQWNSTNQEWGPADSGVQVYATIDDLPLSGVTEGSMALVDSTDKLYIFSDTGWYSIAIVNQTPSITGVNATYTLASDGTATTVTVTATDPESLPITYSIVSDTSGNIATVAQGTGANTNQWTITPSTNEANAGSFTLVFRASDGVNIASASSTFSLEFSVENSNYTTALITSVGANNAVNNSFDDASTNNHTITANGNVTQNTFSPYRHGGYSTYFDGTGDYLTASLTTDFNVGTNDFTVEFWGYLNATGQFHEPFGLGTDGSNGYVIDINSSNYIRLIAHIGGTWTTLITGSTALSANQWYHLAIVRNGSDFDIYVNGTKDATTVTNSGSITDPSGGNQVSVGGYQLASTAWRYFNGYISDLRFVNGTAVYTANFTPPTERLTAVTNTKLLTCHLPYIADGSTNSHTITVNGDAKTEPFGPYDHARYSASIHAGSAYFDGTGDYLEASLSTDFNVGTNSFTIECWYKPNAIGDFHPIFNVGDPANNGYSMDVGNSGNGNSLRFICHIGGTWTNIITGSTALTVGQWYHLAVVRNGNDFDIYLNGTKDATTVTNSGTITNPATDPLRICWYDNSPTWSRYANGIVSDLRFVNGTAVYTAAFTPPTAPLTAITNTKLLLPFDDAGIIDKSQTAKTLTLNGDVKSSTTQSKYLTSSMYFDGTGDYISIPVENGFEFGTGDFTIEMWFWYTGTIARYPIILGNGISGTGIYSGWAVFTDGNVLKLDRYTGTQTTVNFGSFTAAADTWHHLAIARSGTTIRGFINGTQVGSDITNSVSYNAHNTDPLNIGYGVDGNGTHQWNGYMSDIRITKGLARYTANFTAPTAALSG